MSKEPSAVIFDQIDMTKINVKAPQNRTTPVPVGSLAKPIEYKTMQIEYNYGSAESPVWGDFVVQTPLVVCNRGIMSKIFPAKEPGKPDQKVDSVQIVIDKNNTELATFEAYIDAVHGTIAGWINQHKKDLGQSFRDFDVKNTPLVRSKFPHPITLPKEEGRNSCMFIKLEKYGEGTKFFNPKTKTAINWELLRNVKFEAKLHIKFRDIYVGGGKSSLRFNLSKGLVKCLVPGASSDDFGADAEEWAQDDTLSQQLGHQTTFFPPIPKIQESVNNILDNVPSIPETSHSL